ncbi:E3 ubiquitin-protein ligase Iruka isoform X2 [Anthonomus grandis grandis]|uniref:E3 ubiquitin-protein ligase Iruka isoform X2 n=1 Tax=Anthonomus grandis grandis TaxID=2921223 RepID=UPI0021665CE0|nr:E3 ubiquitin-protein ligase Iruka isoform X2 [Anthonomus grandis grandis]
MAEAAVEERPLARFYCHVCNVEFQNAANNFTCPHCSDGFIEELQETRQENPGHSEQNSFFDALDLNDGLVYTAPNMDGRPLTRIASSNLRQQLPMEHLVHDFIINLGVGVNMGVPGNVQLFLGNPGDYAWGREGLDAVVTQMLNQMDSTGPPPLSKAVIDAIQVVEVSQEQVSQNMQCSVCWEHFSFKEQVRQLPCFHIYHELCIRPWLELHGTCPICRQNLGEGDGSNPQGSGGEQQNGSTANQQDSGVLTLPNLLRSLFTELNTATSSRSGQTEQNNPPPPPPPQQMDQSSNSSTPNSSDDGNFFM